jgi:hypothetical protein
MTPQNNQVKRREELLERDGLMLNGVKKKSENGSAEDGTTEDIRASHMENNVPTRFSFPLGPKSGSIIQTHTQTFVSQSSPKFQHNRAASTPFWCQVLHVKPQA